MRLDFHILWIDDQPKHIASFREGIDRRLATLGFVLKVTEVASLEEVEDCVAGHVQDDGIDLVLVDYDLGGGDGGEQALIKIRKLMPFKEIIFYSAADTEKLRKIAFENKVDGAHFATRLTLSDDTSSLVNNILRKVMDIDHMRGVVMAATSDIDWLVEGSLIAIHSALDSASQKEMESGLVEYVKAKLERYGAELGKAQTKGSLAALLKLKHLIGSTDRLDLVIKAMEDTAEGNESSSLAMARTYKNDVVPRRNKLAHVVVKTVDGKKVLEGPGGSFTDEDMTVLRRDLIEHRSNFTSVAVVYDVPMP